MSGGLDDEAPTIDPERVSFREKSSTAALVIAFFALTASDLLAQPDWDVDRPVGSQEMIDRYADLLESSPMSERGLDGLIREFAPHGGIEALITEYGQRVAQAPTDLTPHVILARLYDQNGATESSLPLITRAFELGFDEPAGFVFRGGLLASSGDFVAAESDYDTALRRAEDDDTRIEILRSLGDLYLALGRGEEALAAYNRIADLAPRDRYIRQELAQILYEAGFREAALERYGEVVRLARTNTQDRADAIREVATLEEELGRYEEAITHWEQVRSMTTPGNWLRTEAENGMLRSYRAWGRLERLLSELDGRLTRRTRDPFVLYNRARLLRELGRAEEAVAAYELAISRIPGDPAIRQELVELLLAEGLVAEAVQIVSAALARWPEQVQMALTLADGLIESGLLFDASYVLRSNEAAVWDDATMVWELVGRYRAIGDRAAIDRATARLLELRPDDPRPTLDLADEALERGDVDGAMAIMRPLFRADDPALFEQCITLLQNRGQALRASGLIWEATTRFPHSENIRLLWLVEGQNHTNAELLDGARQLLLTAEGWDVAQQAFAIYLPLIQEAGLERWASDHYQRAYEDSPRDYRVGRLALMFHIVNGDTEKAIRAFSLLKRTAPSVQHPDQWVLATLREWPNPGTLPLLRRLGSDDPTGRWRYEILQADLLNETGRFEESRTVLEGLQSRSSDNPAVLYGVGEVFLQFPQQLDQARGCGLMGDALELEERSIAYRVGTIDCMRDLGNTARAYALAMEGFAFVREVAVADSLFERVIMAIPKGVTRDAVEAELRAVLSHSRSEILDWLDSRLAGWTGP